jgi:benzylsuccinate CoA-transferase BbsE subunit
MFGRPYVLEKTPWQLRRPAPALGQDTESVLAWAGLDADAVPTLRSEGVVA